MTNTNTSICEYDGYWVQLPLDLEGLEILENKINEGMIFDLADYESDYQLINNFIKNYISGDYGSSYINSETIKELNDYVEMIENELSELDLENLDILLENGYISENTTYDVNDLQNYLDRYVILGVDKTLAFCSDNEIIGRTIADYTQVVDEIPEYLQSYFDYAAYGGDYRCAGEAYLDFENAVVILGC